MSDPSAEEAAPAAAGADTSALDFEDLFETAPCGYLATDKDGRIARANQTFAGWTGYAADDLAGRRFSDLLTIAGKIFYETHFAPMLHMQGSFSEVALDMVTADGRKLPVLVNAIERRDPAGRALFIRFTVFIAAVRRTYEQELLAARNQAQANVAAERAEAELRDQFIAVLGHDLRSPIASIASGVRLLEKEALSERGRTVLRLMDGSVVRAVGLIDNVLDFARARLGSGITLDRDANEPLEPVLDQVVGELRSIAPDQFIETRYKLDQPINCDRGRIGQLVSNLLGNALTHGSGDVPVRLEAATASGELAISVSNGGEPIPPAALGRLFEPFYRGEGPARHKGLGLGLHIASEIARAHGGALAVRSNPHETRVSFTMPLAH